MALAVEMTPRRRAAVAPALRLGGLDENQNRDAIDRYVPRRARIHHG
jgi:hypothetical protein